MKTKLDNLIIPAIVFVLFIVTNLVNADLVAHWKLDETEGNTASDSSGNGNKGILYGNPTWTPMEGKYSGAICFGNTNRDRIEISMDALSATEGTISVWIYLAADPQPTRHCYIFGHGTTPFWSNRMQLYFDNGDRQLDLGIGNSHVVATNINTLHPKTWYHIVLTWNRGNFVVYINGVEAKKGSYESFDKLNSIADFGNDGRTDENQRDESFNGFIDEISVYSHALTQYEVTLIHRQNSGLSIHPILCELDNDIRKAEKMFTEQENKKTISFLEEKISKYEQWEKQNPNESSSIQKQLLCELYYLLAKAKEVANAPAVQIFEAYKKSISQMQYRQNYVPALLWLFSNASTDDYIDVLQKSAKDSNGVPENFHLVAKDFELSKNWAAFEFFLDVVFSEVDDDNFFAEAIAAGLSTGSLWYNNLSKYTQNKSQFTQFNIKALDKYAREKMKLNEFVKAIEIYNDILNLCHSNQDMETYQLKVYECLFKSGECDKALSQLNNYINNNQSISKATRTKAMMLKGQIHIQLNEINRACETYSIVMKEYPQIDCAAEACFFIGYCKMIEGKFADAKESFNLVIRNYPQSPYMKKAQFCLSRMDKQKG